MQNPAWPIVRTLSIYPTTAKVILITNVNVEFMDTNIDDRRNSRTHPRIRRKQKN